MHNFINTAGEIPIVKCYSCLQPTFAQHLFQTRDSKIPTVLLSCCLHTRGRSSKPLASPHNLLAVKKRTEMQPNTKEENS